MQVDSRLGKPLLDDLDLFCAVVRRQGFAAAALELGVSNALVSKRIAILEATLQVRLLHRTTRRVSLTEHGSVVHQWAQRILEDVSQLEEAVSAKGSAPHGVLRLCTSSGFGRNWIAPARNPWVSACNARPSADPACPITNNHPMGWRGCRSRISAPTTAPTISAIGTTGKV